MTRSNFDPANPDADQAGRSFLGPQGQRGSQMPEDLIDGEVEEDAPEDNNLSHEALSADEAARKLEAMQSVETPVEDLPQVDGPVE